MAAKTTRKAHTRIIKKMSHNYTKIVHEKTTEKSLQKRVKGLVFI